MQKNAKGQVLFDKICEKIEVAEKDYFGLRYIDEKDGQVFHHKMQSHFPNTVEFRFFDPPGEMKIGLKNWGV